MHKSTIILTAIGLVGSSSLADAAVPTQAPPFQVVAPNIASGLEITVEGLYVRPAGTDLTYAASGPVPSDSSGIDLPSQTSTVNPKYEYGYKIGLGYVFPDSTNDVQASWTRFNHSYSSNTGFTGQSSGVRLTTNFGNTYDLFAGDSAQVGSTVKIPYDAIDLNVGQYLDVGTRLHMRLFAGLRYADIEENVTTVYAAKQTTESTTTNTTETDSTNSKFIGLGPNLGVNTSYHMGNHWGVTTGASAAFLVDLGKSSADATQSIQIGSQTPSSQTFSPDTTAHVVPGWDAKLGLSYSAPMTRRSSTSQFTVEAGYKVIQYTNAVVDAVTGNKSNINFDGPYLALNFKL